MQAGEITGHVLVVDDDMRNRELLHDILEAAGHAITEAEDGPAALDAVRANPPDVILLDVMMPGIDGFETCRRIRANESTAAIPVIMVTALQDRHDRLEGIRAGANDFLTKPIDGQDVALRVRNAVYGKQLFDQVRESYRKLHELEDMRDKLVHMIVHDMRTPLMGILWDLEMLITKSGIPDQAAADQIDNLERSRAVCYQLIEMVSSVLDASRIEEGKMPLMLEAHSLVEILTECVASLGSVPGERTFAVNVTTDPGMVRCDRNLVARVITNLLSNAIRFSPTGGEIVLSLERNAGTAKLSVKDAGGGIPADRQEAIFEKYGQVLASDGGGSRYSTGLGLTFCKLAVESHDGTIGVESRPGQGSTFWFTLPVAGPRGAPRG